MLKRMVGQQWPVELSRQGFNYGKSLLSVARVIREFRSNSSRNDDTFVPFASVDPNVLLLSYPIHEVHISQKGLQKVLVSARVLTGNVD